MMPSLRASVCAASSASCVGGGDVFGAALFAQPGMLRADQRVIESRRNGMRQRHLPFGVLQQVAVGAVQHAGRSAGETRRMFARAPRRGRPPRRRSGAHPIVQKRVEHADGIAAPAHTGEHRIRQTALALQNLARVFIADDAMKIADHHRDRDARPAPSRAGNACCRHWSPNRASLR